MKGGGLTWGDRRRAMMHAALKPHVCGSRTVSASSQKLAMLVIDWFAGDGSACWASHEVMAGVAMMNEGTLRRALRALEEQGLIDVQRRSREKGGRTTSKVWLNLRAIVELVPEEFLEQGMREWLALDETSAPEARSVGGSSSGADGASAPEARSVGESANVGGEAIVPPAQMAGASAPEARGERASGTEKRASGTMIINQSNNSSSRGSEDGPSAAAPSGGAAAADTQTGGEGEADAIAALVAAGITEPTKSRLVATPGVSGPLVRRVHTAWKARGGGGALGVGALVRDIQGAAAASCAEQQRRTEGLTRAEAEEREAVRAERERKARCDAIERAYDELSEEQRAAVLPDALQTFPEFFRKRYAGRETDALKLRHVREAVVQLASGAPSGARTVGAAGGVR